MRIEDFWEDTEVYYVRFKTIENKIVSKFIVLDPRTSMKEVENIILSKFNRTKEVLSIDIIGESLSLKKFASSYKN